MLVRSLSMALASFFVCSTASAAGLQAQCSDEAGRGFALQGGIINGSNAGWYDDTMRGETVIRVDTDSGAAEVRFRDATGIWQSVTDQGGTARLWNATDGAFLVAVTYPNATIETLIVGEIQDNTATLVHTVSRATDRISNARVMTARCVLASY